jgi:hypothetical protein
MKKTGKLYYDDPEGERHILGTMEFELKAKRGKIMQTLLEAFWEPRLDSASCRPVVEINDPTEGRCPECRGDGSHKFDCSHAR